MSAPPPAPPPEASAATVPPPALTIPRAPRAARLKDLAFQGGMLACLGIALITLAAVLVQVFSKGFGQLSLDFITELGSSLPAKAGIGSALVGTLWVIAVCIAFIVPVGVASAVYLEEYADRSRWYNRLIEVNIQNLAAVPSIVYGILGLAFLVRGPLSLGPVVLAGGLTLGLLVLPVVIIAGREAIRAVPPSIREGSMALGATQWQTIWRQVLPAAIPGVATGVILALSRAIGETAPLIVIGTPVFVAFNPNGLDSSFTAMPIQIFDWISRPSNDVNNYLPLAAAGILLLMIVLLLMNAIAIWLRNRYEQKW
jgi:phosphate transport system permease protein